MKTNNLNKFIIEVYERTLKNFTKTCSSSLSLSLNKDKLSHVTEPHPRMAVGSARLSNNFTYDSIRQKILTFTNFVILAETEEDGVKKIIAFNRPLRDEMYVIHLESYPYGYLNKITYHLFPSMEYMRMFLLDERDKIKEMKEGTYKVLPQGELLKYV